MKKLLMKVLVLTVSLVMILSLAGCTEKNIDSKKDIEVKPIEKEMQQYYVDAKWLKDNLDKVIIIDANTDKLYNNNHIKGAINITWQSVSNMTPKQGEIGWGVILPKEELEKKLGNFGINNDKTIIIYNDPKGLGEEGRILWTLRVAGLKNTKILNGGLPTWISAGGETSKEATTLKPVDFKIEKYDDSLIANTDYVKNNLDKIKLIDTRSPEENQGKTNHGEKALGRIPSSIYLNYADLYNIDGTIKSISEIKEILTQLGIKQDDEIVTYCTVGIRSGFTAEILQMAGYTKAKNYNASFSEWAGLGLEVEK